MKLDLYRKTKDQNAIVGTLSVDGVQNCFTLERTGVEIRAGLYSIELTYSPHFDRIMPLLDGVIGRTDIRVHPANWPTQLKGCIAVGQSSGVDYVDNSLAAFNPLEVAIAHSLALEERVTIEIHDI